MSEFILPIFFGLLFAWFVFDTIKREQMRKVKHELSRTKELFERAGYRLPPVNDMAVYPRYWHLWTVKQWIRWADRQQGETK